MEDLNFERVRAMLHARLSGRGIDVDKVYINGIYKLEDPQVIYSQTLPWAFLLMLQDGEVPEFGGEKMGIFSKAYTFDDYYLFKDLEFDEVNELGVKIAKYFLAESADQ